MANNIAVTEGSGKTVSTEDIGSAQYQRIKIVGGETGSTSVLAVTPDGAMKVSVLGVISTTQSGTNITSISGTISINPASVSGTIGASVIGTAPVTQSGAWTTSVVGNLSINSVIGAITLFAQPDSFVSGVTSVITGTSATSVLAAPGASLRNYITQITVTNAAASAAIVDIKDTGANVLHSGYAAASGGGFTATFPVPIRQPNTNASVDAVPRSQASIIVAISGYKSS